ncbi:PREDICTED: 25-hydroxycholesterol 7-alpha-hydroxylase [Apaloderma vittatum]|uniref:25-hydroxycholesterol 7-alpha-hydroxylase n=1 Tax=Apaloderma vittatum TaxID=57397 RepID=UPI00052181C5|nr:PREDICTED: 25-hydroxycholesterol 7-alpha-hydroxylase [Apaloderma vittatum]
MEKLNKTHQQQPYAFSMPVQYVDGGQDSRKTLTEDELEVKAARQYIKVQKRLMKEMDIRRESLGSLGQSQSDLYPNEKAEVISTGPFYLDKCIGGSTVGLFRPLMKVVEERSAEPAVPCGVTWPCSGFFSCAVLQKTGEPPLINGWIPYLGKALIFRKDAFKFLLDQQKKLGDIFTVHIAGRYITFIMDPFQYVYVIRNSKQLEFHEFADKMASKTFDYPALSNGKFPDLKENLHRIYQYLQGKPLDIISDHMMKNLQDIFEWKCSQATDWETEKMYKFCCSVMFEASFVTLYGRVPAADGHKVISEIRDKFIKFDASFPYLAANIPIELLGATKKVRKELIHHFLLQNMTKWLGGSKVVQARQDIFEKYELLGDYDKAAHHFAFLWASVGNTIPATFWAMYYLLRHPEALAAVRDEIDHLLQSTGQKRGPTYNIHLTREQLDNLVYLESALNESLRMCSSSMNIRISQEDFVLKLEGNQEVGLRKGDWIALYPQILHMDPEVYEDPKEYKFDRYIENGKKKTTFYKAGRKLKYFLMPFGSGISMCPGRFLAMNEMKMFLFLLLAHFDVELVENKAVRLDNSRMGLGILLPDVDIAFRYKLRALRM